MGKVQLRHAFEEIISVQNLLAAWQEFIRGKRGRKDVQEFSLRLMDNILSLQSDLANFTYKHGGYHAFRISDPKPRDIHKAPVRDRLLHHVIYRILYPFFNRTFIADSYSCRIGKGTHKALNQFRSYARKASRNHTRTAWVLKCDIRKFFANIDHAVLMRILESCIPDKDILRLLARILQSFHSVRPGIGLPLGNLTSQLFVNIYMNEFDQFMKHKLKARYYIRYADDFVLLSESRDRLCCQVPLIREFLLCRLKLELHPNKIFIKTFASGVDFLGWVHFSDHRVLRTTAQRRMFKNLANQHGSNETVHSYLGLLQHGNARALQNQIINMYK